MIKKMKKIKCPLCGQTLIFADFINAELKCSRCKKIIKIYKEKSEEHIRTEVK